MCDDGVPRTSLRMRARRRGFTLIELVVVLLLIAVATAVTVPAFLDGEPRQTDLDAATERISLLFRLARDSAVHSGMPVTVSIDSITGTAWLVTGADAQDAATVSNVGRPAGALHVTPGESLALPMSVRLELASARARFRFSPGGAAFGDTIVLRTNTGARAITLDPWTGDAVTY